MSYGSLEFLGAVRTVTGSATLLSYGGMKILVDCGMFQGPRDVRKLNWEIYDRQRAESVDAVILTHAHVDHSGLLPRLFQLGFRGPVYCTQGTRNLCDVLLPDSAYLQEEDARRYKGSGRDQTRGPLYTVKEANEALKLLKVCQRNEWIELTKGLSFRLIRSGHILGSSFVQFSISKGNGVRLVTFSGDLGNGRQNVIKGPDDIFETDDLILESTYGDRNQPRTDPMNDLAESIREIGKSGGVLLIPAFAVGRTQEILYMIRRLCEEKKIPDIDVYLDSPMALEATELYMGDKEDIKDHIFQDQVVPPLSPGLFHSVKKMEDSIRLMKKEGPLVIISAAGMLTGGRILYHLKERLPDPRNQVLFVGFQAEETKGRLLQQGLKNIRLHKENVPVRAKIKTVDSLSAHADSDELVEWVRRFERQPERVFLNHGEITSMRSLAYRIRYELGLEVIIPQTGEKFSLSK